MGFLAGKKTCRSFMIFCVLLNVSFATTIKIGVLLMTSAPEPFDLRRTAPALSIAFEVAQRDFGITFDAVYHNYTGFCPKETVVGHLSELYYTHNVQAVIGPACSGTIIAAGRLAQYMRLPMVTGLGDLVVRDEADKDMYTSLTILSYNLRKLSLSLFAILKRYGWRHTAILYDQTYVFFDLAGSNLVYDFRENPELDRPYDVGFIPEKIPDLGTILQDASAHARVIIIFCNSDLLRDILARADDLGMTRGGYVFITMELFPSDWLGYYTLYYRGDGKDEAVGRAYESLLILTLKQPNNPEYYTFAEEVKRRALSQYGYQFGPDEKVNYFITAFYDSALYLALAYRKCLDSGEDIRDGMLVAQKLWNSSFEGITGTVAIDKVGNRIADFDLLDMKSSSTKEFQMVGRFYGASQHYAVVDGTEIVWPYGKPVDVPVCGFRGDQCQTDTSSRLVIVLTVSVTVVIIIGIAAILIYLLVSKMKREQDLDRKTWLISPDDIQVRKGRMTDSFLSRSLASVRSGNQTSPWMMNKDFGVDFTKTAFCKGHVVAVRKLHLDSIELTRNVTIEFREMQRLFNPHLTKFVGLCMEPSNIRIMYEYCPRGSLQDMLQNDHIDLDWNFRYSLINDIIKGMTYLHASRVRCHGRLTSANCVIDSSFSLKLTDYGLHSVFIKERSEERKMSSQAGIFNARKLLWTAPEHLNSGGVVVGISQTGDVYSFGIILQEIATRSGPFEDSDLTSEEILEKLIHPVDVFRPTVPTDACSKELHLMMQGCWNSNPLERPSFLDIQKNFKLIRAGKSTNIMDNLLERMSQYANNLESLAAERTKAYLDEKQRAQELLYRLLPPSVAHQLEKGGRVTPELYNCVTIYFSDIVGFTTIAAVSSPIQVVDFLNDLYTAFDSKIVQFQVYKVETIGDAYMVASGLPEKNGDLHVKEICDMSLEIVALAKKFKIGHLPSEQLKIRVGIHSGPVVAGVVGLTMPRYCLFGDTVNTASRMESTSEAQRIHLSQSSKRLLEAFPGYTIKERGQIQVKGKGTMETYWLEESKGKTLVEVAVDRFKLHHQHV